MACRRRMKIDMRVLAGAIVLILAAGCGSSRTAAPRITTTPSAGGSLASPREHQIALARASDVLFSIFPAKPGAKSCVIGGGGFRTTPLRGVCSTSIRRAQAHGPELIVSFTERWAYQPCRSGTECVLEHTFHHTWHVLETEPILTQGARLHIAATQESGAPAPQFYK